MFDFCSDGLKQALISQRQMMAGASATAAVNTDINSQEMFSGVYKLTAMVTHKGRAADSGHYKAYVRESVDSDNWRCFDDDKVSEHSTEDILRLRGNGDSDMAYLCFYRRMTVRK